MPQTKPSAEQITFTPSGVGAVATTVENQLRYWDERDFSNGESKTAYIETFIDQISYPAIPNNAPSLATYPATPEWNAAVLAGAAGATTVTTENNSFVSGLTTQTWPCAFENVDGTFDVNLVTSFTGTTFNLYYPLKKQAARIYSRWGDSQHMSPSGTKAYAEHVYRQKRAVCVADRFMDKAVFALQRPTYQRLFALNPALVAYGRQIINNIPTELASDTATANSAGNGRIRYVMRDPAGVSVGVHLIGHGIIGSIVTAKKAGYFEAFVCTSAGSLTPTTRGEGIIEVYGLNRGSQRILISSLTFKDNCTRFICPVEGFDSIEVEVKSTVNGAFGILVQQSRFWVTDEPYSQLIDKNGTIVCVGDSWFEFYGDLFHTHLQSLITADGGTGKVFNFALSGQTVDYGINNLASILAFNPTQVIINFFTNDLNSGTPDVLTAKLHKFCSLLEQNGVQPIVIQPAGTSSDAQSINHQLANARIRLGRYSEEVFTATLSELADATSFVNTVGKYPGRRAIVGNDSVYATGGAAADAWTNFQNVRIGLLEANTFDPSGNDVADWDIGTDSNADGLSDGVTVATTGTIFSSTATNSIVGGVQFQTIEYTASNDNSLRRLEFSAPVTIGREYMMIVELDQCTPNMPLEFVYRSTGGGVAAFAAGEVKDGLTGLAVNSPRITDVNGDRLLYVRHTAAATGNYGPMISNSGSRASVPVTYVVGVKRVNMIDLTDFASVFGINLASYSDFDLFKLINSSLTLIPKKSFRMTDSVTGDVVTITVESGVLTVS